MLAWQVGKARWQCRHEEKVMTATGTPASLREDYLNQVQRVFSQLDR
jgi:hypothetical protein